MRQNLGGERWSRVNVLERESWKVVDAFEVPVPEIYAIARVPRALAEGVRRSESPLSSLGARSVNLGWGVTDLVPTASRRFTIEAEVPRALVVNTHLKLSCRVTNHSDMQIGSFGPHPVDLSYRWEGDDGLPVRQAIRFDLSQDVAPGESCDVEVIVAAPDRCGTFRLTLFLTQAETAWSNALPRNPRRATTSPSSKGTPLSWRRCSRLSPLSPVAHAPAKPTTRPPCSRRLTACSRSPGTAGDHRSTPDRLASPGRHVAVPVDRRRGAGDVRPHRVRRSRGRGDPSRRRDGERLGAASRALAPIVPVTGRRYRPTRRFTTSSWSRTRSCAASRSVFTPIRLGRGKRRISHDFAR